MRHVILHYHLFKNAGTSLDGVLQYNFNGHWVTQEFPAERPDNTQRVRQWIMDTPNAIAFSSHTMIGPVPQIDGVKIIPILLLRDPIARIKSAYLFERTQQAQTRGAHLAKAHTLDGYINARLSHPGDRQCRNFQTARLASMVPGIASEKDRAFQACDMLQHRGVLGLVNEFEAAMKRLYQKIMPVYPQFSAQSQRRNVSSNQNDASISAEMHSKLIQNNQDDLDLIDYAQQRIRGDANLSAG